MPPLQTLTHRTLSAISDGQDPDRQRWGWDRFDRRYRARVIWKAQRRGLTLEDAEDCAGEVMKTMVEPT